MSSCHASNSHLRHLDLIEQLGATIQRLQQFHLRQWLLGPAVLAADEDTVAVVAKREQAAESLCPTSLPKGKNRSSA